MRRAVIASVDSHGGQLPEARVDRLGDFWSGMACGSLEITQEIRNQGDPGIRVDPERKGPDSYRGVRTGQV